VDKLGGKKFKIQFWRVVNSRRLAAGGKFWRKFHRLIMLSLLT
jgi:hypothetical protein